MENEGNQRIIDDHDQLDEKMENRRIILAEFLPMVRTLQTDVLRRFEMIDQFHQDGRGKLFGEAFASVVAGEILLVDPFDLLQIA